MASPGQATSSTRLPPDPPPRRPSPGPVPSRRSAKTSSRALVAPANRAASNCTMASSRSSRSRAISRAPSRMLRAHVPAVSRTGARARRSPAGTRAEAVKEVALNQNAGATPKMATSTPPSGASATWYTTAADHRPLFAATSSCSLTMQGRTDAAAGMKNTATADRPNPIAHTAARWWCPQNCRTLPWWLATRSR
jgi:hypothetical protein